MTKRRQISLLPQVHQTDVLKRFFGSTVDQLFESGKTVPVSGYIGREPDHYDPAKDFYKPEPTHARKKYQLEPMMISANQDGEIEAQLFYEDLLSNLNQEGALTDDPNRLFGAGYYSWAPPLDIDRIMNFQQYYWAGANTTSLILTVPGVEVGARHYGDGATSDFRLPPKLPSRDDSEEDVVVLVDGVIVNENLYTLSSTEVEFATPPAADVLIVIFRYGNVSNGTRTTFLIPQHCTASEGTDTVFVFLNGRETTDFVVNENTITLNTAAAANTHVMVTRIKDLKERIEGRPQFDPSGLTFYPVTELLDGMKVKLVDPVNFMTGYDLKAYGHPWDEIGHSTFFVEGVDISIILIPIAGSDFTGDGYGADDPRYVVIARNDRTRSWWSRVNRWVHKNALINPEDANVENRAKRPIIEFLPNIQQFDYGRYRIQNTSGKISSAPLWEGAPISFVDINGLPEGSVKIDDGYSPMKGDYIFVNLPNSEFNHRIYHVDTVTTENDPSTQLYLLEPLADLEYGAITQIKLKEYWYDGRGWHEVVEQYEAPLFDLFDHDGHSLADPGVYPNSSFRGSRIFSFAEGSGLDDGVLRKKLRHDKYGQIIFENELETRRYTYRDGDIIGYHYYQRDDQFLNSWHRADAKLRQAIDENNVSEIPLNLQANPDFDTPTFLSRNDFFEHFSSILVNQDGFEGQPFSANNWNKTAKDVTKGLVVIQHEAPLLRLMALMENKEISLTAAIHFMDREYTRFKAKFLKHVLDISHEQDATVVPHDTLSAMALRRVNAGKTANFPFHDSQVGGGNFFIPLTPALIGINRLTRPETFVDDTFGDPVTFIRGHDGSCTAAFGDVRDDALLALETRIFNNAVEFKDRMRMDDLVSAKYRDGLYTQEELSTIMLPMFEKWARENGVVYENTTFEENDPFTWNYRSCTDRYGDDVKGHWRGIYLDFFDTDKPHLAPWEMLGFAQEPEWWETRYGGAPYSRANTILWEDIEAGIIREGDRAGTYDKYKRPDLMQILPIDINGGLLDPMAATIVQVAPPIQFARNGWQFGDGSNIEAIWKFTSSYRFSVALSKFLMRPAYFVERYWDVLNETLVHGHQVVQTPFMRRIHHREVLANGEELLDGSVHRTVGVQNWIVDFLIHAGKQPERLGRIVRGLSTQLGHKVAGFTTKDRMTISAESFGLVPDEDIVISLYRSPSMSEYFYSGMLIENTPTGWRVVGYNPEYPFFDVILGEEASRKIKINSGRTDTERAINPWHASVYYKKDMLVEYEQQVYRCLTAHTSAQKFEESFWVRNPVKGNKRATTVYKHSKSSGIAARIEYGSEFHTKQEIADLIFGYERWLIEQGFVFAESDADNASWTTAVRNFLRWSEVEWAAGAFVTLSPAARSLKFVAPRGLVIEMENSLIDRTGHVFKPENFSVDRDETETIITAHVDDIYGARLNRTEYEHCLIFANETIFGDILFNPLFNIRQYRLKMSARVAGNWAGRYEAPGFVIQGNEIVPNFVKLGEDIREMFDIELADNTVLRDHARHVIGFESRPYLDKLLLNETQQFEMYQGMIQQKGSAGALSTILRSNEIAQSRDLKFLEEWAFRVGTFGANHPTYRMEFTVLQSDIHNEKQIIHLSDQGKLDWLNLTADRWVSSPTDLRDLMVTKTTETLPDAGYVRPGEVSYVVRKLADFHDMIGSELEIYEGQTIWTTHGDTWDVQRLTYPTDDLAPIEIIRFDNEFTGQREFVENNRITFDREHNLLADDLIMLVGGTYSRYVGVYGILRVGPTWVEIGESMPPMDYEFPEIDATPPMALTTRSLRLRDIEERDALPDYPNGTICYVDDVDGKWKVFKKQVSVWVEMRRQPKKMENKQLTSAVIYDHDSRLSPLQLVVEPAVPDRLVVVDPLAGLIPGIVDRELDYKIEYDPVDYETWGPEELGTTWWDLSTVRFINYYTDAAEEFDHDSARYDAELTYRSESWGKISETSTVDVYEWTRSLTPPEDTADYVERQEYDAGLNRTMVVFYFWKRNPTTTPRNSHRRLSAHACSVILQNPAKAGLVWYAAMADSAVLLCGTRSLFDDDGRIMQIEFKITDYEGDEHSEWTLLRPKDKTTVPPSVLWTKLLDSQRTFNLDLKHLPSAALHPTQRSGLMGLQSMFGDLEKREFRESFVTMVNYILARKNHSRIGLLEEKLSLADNPPEYLYWTAHTGDLALLPPKIEYDHLVYSHDELEDALTKYYRVLVDNRGADAPSWSVWRRGENGPEIIKGYDHVVGSRAELAEIFFNMSFKDRVLVLNDEEADGFWTIWEKRGDGAWDIEPFDEFVYDGFEGATLGLVNAQKYRTRDFWYFADWYDESVDTRMPPPVTYQTIAQRNVTEGERPSNLFVKVLDDNGYWSWSRYNNGDWTTVAKENATIQLEPAFFGLPDVYGYKDEELYLDVSLIRGRDGSLDLSPLVEALRQHVLTVEEVNELWFSTIHFIHSKIDKVDWAAKTSFLNVMGFNERLWASPVALNDNMPLLLQYIDEVKPYHVKVRDILRTAAPDIDVADTTVTDFDKPVWFDAVREQFRKLFPETDAAILSQGLYRHWTNNEEQRRKVKIGLSFDRIWPEANEGSGAAERIMAFYQPGSNMRERNLTELLDLDFKGTVYDGSSFGDTDYDVLLRGTNSEGSQIDLNVEGGFKMRDPHVAPNKPQELVSIGIHDGLVFRAHDRWGNGAPQHTVRYYDVSRRKSATATLDVGALVDSVAVFRDGIRVDESEYTFDQLAHTVTVNLVIYGDRAESVAIHGFGFAAVDRIREQRYYKGGADSYELFEAYSGLVEANVNGAVLDQQDVEVNYHEVVLPATTASDAVMLTAYSTDEPRPIRQKIEKLDWNAAKEWQLQYLPMMRPYHGAVIVEKNGLRLTPPRTYYAMSETSYFVGDVPASSMQVWDNRAGTSHPVTDLTTITTQEFDSEVSVRAAIGEERFVLWKDRIIFGDTDAAARDYVVTVNVGHDFTISDAGELHVLIDLIDDDDLRVTSFTHDEKMDVRTHVFEGNPHGYYPLRTTRNGRAWLTIDGKRLVENVDFVITDREGGAWDIDPFETFTYDAFRFVQIAIRFPGELPPRDVVITTFEGRENNPAGSWQMSTTTPEEMRLLPANESGDIMYVVRKAWEIAALDPIRRAGALLTDVGREDNEITVKINPSEVPSKMIPSQPLHVPDDSGPGVVWIDGERIEYFDYSRSGNTIKLAQLRRGTRGTSQAPHVAGNLAMGVHELDRLPPSPSGDPDNCGPKTPFDPQPCDVEPTVEE
jgi:hypothetical protein